MAASHGDHLKIVAGTLVHGQYEVLREVGCGNFSKVYEVRNIHAPSDAKTVALKVVKKEYSNDAKFEKDMLKILGAKGLDSQAAGASSVSTMHEFFTWNQFPCFIMPLRGPTLRSCKMGIERGNCSRDDFVRLAHALLTALKFVHFDCKMVHTDLKPENILLNDTAQSGSPLGTSWTICDFGSASLWRAERMDSDLISTRPYRAPEVVLGNPWSYPADTWSLGCILYEVAVGSRLFDVHDDNTHLSLMEKRLGRLPDTLAKKSKNSRKYFDPNGNLNRPSVRAAQGSACRAVAAARSPRPLQEVFADDDEVFDLISSMLQYDPARRIRTDDALHHPLFDSMELCISTNSESSNKAKNVDGAAAAAAVKVVSPKAVSGEEGAPAKSTAAQLEARLAAAMQKVSPLPTPASTPDLSSETNSTNSKNDPSTTATTVQSTAAAAAAVKYRVPISLLTAMGEGGSKENHLIPSSLHHSVRAKVLSKANSSNALTMLSRATPSPQLVGTTSAMQRTGSATAVRPQGQQVNRSTYANYALRLKVHNSTRA